MSSARIWHGVTRSLLTLGMTMLVIGIILVTIPGNIFTIGVFFLVAGVIGVIIYLLFTVAMCFSKQPSTRTMTVEQTPQGRTTQESNQESSAVYSVPTYEEVVDSRFLPPATEVWTVNLSPGQSPLIAELGEPPLYSMVELEPGGPGGFTNANMRENDFRDGSSPAAMIPTTDHSGVPETHSSLVTGPRLMMPHQLRRISSDVHEILELKNVSMQLEPMTPPPAYLDILENPLAEADFQAVE